ncbi:hypothetical protein M885DRAFT_541864 [Pelagophyceae sp. CCMP2097]|nr:hypothetical protein M885DRAFT_541864 [Pelagophyceae sp. CCMP2097]
MKAAAPPGAGAQPLPILRPRRRRGSSPPPWVTRRFRGHAAAARRSISIHAASLGPNHPRRCNARRWRFIMFRLCASMRCCVAIACCFLIFSYFSFSRRRCFERRGPARAGYDACASLSSSSQFSGFSGILICVKASAASLVCSMVSLEAFRASSRKDRSTDEMSRDKSISESFDTAFGAFGALTGASDGASPSSEDEEDNLRIKEVNANGRG